VLSCSFDGSIKFWDPQRGDCLNTLVIEGPYAGMNMCRIKYIFAARRQGNREIGRQVDR